MTCIFATESAIASFKDTAVQEFVKMNMKGSYEEAILTHHPCAAKIPVLSLRRAIHSFVAELFDRFPEELTSLSDLDGLVCEFRERRKAIPYLQEAYARYRSHAKQKNRFSYLHPHLKGRKWVDIGCGSGELLNYLRANHASSFDAILGIEVGHFQQCANYFDFLICDLKKERPVIERSYDSGILLSVLHHVSSDDETLSTFLRNLHSLGIHRLVVEEDVLLEIPDFSLFGVDAARAAIRRQPKLERYLQLSLDAQIGVTAMADYFSNSLFGSHQMPFPFSFKTCSDWTALFESAGWRAGRIQLLGFQRGNFNQVCHALFVLDSI